MDHEDFEQAKLEAARRFSRRMSEPRPGHSAGWMVLWVAVGFTVLASIFVASALYTDRPAFCGSCHEMVPYVNAWAGGPHADVSCIECHVARGLPARLSHKFIALGEVRSHLLGDTLFPRQVAPNVPNDRCLRCHPSMPQTTAPRIPARPARTKGHLPELPRGHGARGDAGGTSGGRHARAVHPDACA